MAKPRFWPCNPVKVLGKEPEFVSCTFSGGGLGDGTLEAGLGIELMDRTGGGVYEITFSSRYPTLVAVQAQVSAQTPVFRRVIWDWNSYVAGTSYSGPKISFSLFDAAGAAQDLSTSQYISFLAHFKDADR